MWADSWTDLDTRWENQEWIIAFNFGGCDRLVPSEGGRAKRAVSFGAQVPPTTVRDQSVPVIVLSGRRSFPPLKAPNHQIVVHRSDAFQIFPSTESGAFSHGSFVPVVQSVMNRIKLHTTLPFRAPPNQGLHVVLTYTLNSAPSSRLFSQCVLSFSHPHSP